MGNVKQKKCVLPVCVEKVENIITIEKKKASPVAMKDVMACLFA